LIPAARYYYGEPENEVCINSVNASEHSVSTTCIFTMGESQMLKYFMDQFPTGILSVVSDTFDLWKLITEYLPENKEQIMSRDGKLVIRPDSGDPVDIICGTNPDVNANTYHQDTIGKGVIELLWDIFGGTINEQGFKVLDPHIGAIYGDSINLERQLEIYKRLEAKGFAATNIVLGVGSFTYQMNTRDTLGFAAKGAWFMTNGEAHNIYKDPVTDNGTKKSLKGLCAVHLHEDGSYSVQTECTEAEEQGGVLQVIYENGRFKNETTLTQIRTRIDKLINV
jgi:nicotinamide phosphoribosyltransferase